MASILGAVKGAIAGFSGLAALPPPSAGGGRPIAQSSFLRAFEPGARALWGWRAALREPNDEYAMAAIDVISKAIDSLHNSGWLAGGVDQAVGAMVGSGLKLKARPDPTFFSDGAVGAAAWARMVEPRFMAWANDPYACDLYGRQTLGQMVAQGLKQWFATGEIVGLLRYRMRPGNRSGVKVQMVPPKRIPYTAMDKTSVQGCYLDADGCVIGYAFANYDPRQPYQRTDEVRIPARDQLGRPIVIHVHDSPSTVLRGISPLAPVLQLVKQYDQLANATLVTALIHAIFAATIESPVPKTEDILGAFQTPEEQAGAADDVEGMGPAGSPLTDWLGAKPGWYSQSKINLGENGKIVHLFPGDKLEFKASQSPNSTFKEHARFLLREVAKCMGLTYEQLTGDREGATYSSERMGGAEQHLITQYRREHLANPPMQAAYEAWCEEQIESQSITFPGGINAFRSDRIAAAATDWRGPPKPTADDYKSAKANETLLQNGVMSREQWCAELGYDVEDVDDQRAREQAYAKKLKLEPLAQGKGGVAGPDPNSNDQPERLIAPPAETLALPAVA